MQTKVLNNGTEVVATLEEDGAIYAVTYANRTQAENRANKLGAEWTVYQFGRPFYVGKAKNPPNETAPETVTMESFIRSISNIDIDFVDKSVLESMVATAKKLLPVVH